MGGRPRGARCQHPRNVWQLLDQRKDRDPIDMLSEIANSQLVDMNIRVQAMGMLASYKHGKRPAYRYIEDVVGMKAPKTLEEARQYLARISALVAEGKLDVDGGLAIQSLLQSYIDAVVGSEVDQRLRVLEELAHEQAARGFGAAVTVVGGLPILPGCETTLKMPNVSAPTIEHQKPNPWGNVPDAASGVDAALRPRKRGPGRPRKYADQVPEPPPTPDPDDDPEPS